MIYPKYLSYFFFLKIINDSFHINNFTSPQSSPERRGGYSAPSPFQEKAGDEVQTTLHKTIKKVTEDIENMNFNTAVSSMMVLLNEMEKCESVNLKDYKI